ncbi:hypothetical protein SBX64_15905 [Vibrio rhizosphaerae]|uniref:Uncharacterized protein n=1 Tax=Vibrio rhizosphaerae TaxID=398736 RepID=A0ABU4J0J3_9VIBR|nr:hypothetical protein [Vibrio rhizosphaerae]MDW6094023.1 hypothetical protein [Vibrio rhizosphaerae]
MAIRATTKKPQHKDNNTMNILHLVSEDEESSFNSFIDHGVSRIKTNREFCGLSLSDFVQFILDGDISGKTIDGLIRTILTMQFEPDITQIVTLETYKENFSELLERYIEKNHQKVLKGYREHIQSIRTEAAIETYEHQKLSNF